MECSATLFDQEVCLLGLLSGLPPELMKEMAVLLG